MAGRAIWRKEWMSILGFVLGMLLVLATDLLYSVENDNFPPLLDLNLVGQVLVAVSVLWLGMRQRVPWGVWLFLIVAGCALLASMVLELRFVRSALSLGTEGYNLKKAVIQLFLNDLAVGLLLGGFCASLVVASRRQQALAEETSKRIDAEGRLSRLFDAAGMFPWELNLDANRFTILGKQASEIVGYPLDAMLQPGFWLSKVHPDDRARGAEWLRRVLRGDQGLEIDFRVARPSGEYIWLRDVGAMGPFPGEGQVVRGFAIDITESRRAQAALAESEERFRRAFEDSPLGIALVGLDCRFTRINRTLANMLGYGIHELEGRHFTEISHPDDAEADADLAKKMLRGELLENKVEKRYVAKNGELVWVSVTATMIRNAEGDVEYGLAMVKDIRERKEAEDALKRAHDQLERHVEERTEELVRTNKALQEEVALRRQTEAALRKRERESQQQFIELDALYRGAPVGLCVLDSNLRYVRINNRLAEMNELTAADHLGKSVHEMVPAVAAALEPLLRQVLKTGQAISDVEVTGQTLGYPGFDRTWRASFYPAKIGEGETGVGCIVQETSEQTRMQAQLTQHRSELAHVARQSMLGELAAGLAHELNQPLSAIANYAAGSLRRLQSTDASGLDDALTEIAREARRASEIIQRLRHLVRKREPRLATINLNELVREALTLAEVELKQQRARLEIDLAGSLPSIVGDPILLEQVVLNLVRNALDAMVATPSRERRIVIRTSAAESCVQLSVSDTGTGIPPEGSEQWFQPFYTTRPEGLGMGLAISRSIVAAHHGELHAESNEPCGTTLIMTLPLTADET